MVDAIETAYGSCIRFELAFTDEVGADFNVISADISEVIGTQIFDERPAADAVGHLDDATLANSLMRVEQEI